MKFLVKHLHFVGIGGSGMSGIAEVLLNLGYVVSGSDLARSPVTERLQKLGARIAYGHDKRNIKGADAVVISSAVKADNPEVAAAREFGIPVVPRAETAAEDEEPQTALTPREAFVGRIDREDVRAHGIPRRTSLLFGPASRAARKSTGEKAAHGHQGLRGKKQIRVAVHEDEGNAERLRGVAHGNGHVAARREDRVGLQFPENPSRLDTAREKLHAALDGPDEAAPAHALKVQGVKINAVLFDEGRFHPRRRADPGDAPAARSHDGRHGEPRHHVSARPRRSDDEMSFRTHT